MDARVTTPPASLPLTWEQMKPHVSVADERHRLLVMSYVADATAHAEERMQCSLVTRTITATYYAGEEIVLPRGPIAEVVSVKDAANADVAYGRQTIGHRTTLIVPASTSYPLVVVYRAGYGDPADVPADITGKIRIHAATLFAYREDVTPAAANAVHRLDDYYRYRSRGTPVA